MSSLKSRISNWILRARARARFPSDARVLRGDLKALGYELGRQLAPGLATSSPPGEPKVRNLGWRPSTQADVESPWFAHWCAELQVAPLYHRKLWEYAYVLQAFHDAGVLREGASGLGFGCGEEPLASYLASRGAQVTVTDLDPARARGRGWMESGQHTSAIENAYKPGLVSRQAFDRLVRLEYVDMNQVPDHLKERHDFCWSICAFEHLGSFENGLRFVERSLDTLRPGGVAVHTSEFAYLDEDPVVGRGPTVLFQRRHYLDLADRLRRRGYEFGPIDFSLGTGPLDRFVDLPPYTEDAMGPAWASLGTSMAHLKLLLGGTHSTCFGVVVRKPARAG